MKKIALSMVMVGALFFGTTAVFAQTPTGTSVSPTFKARITERAENLVDRLKDKANREIDRRIAGLNRLIDLINRIKHLTDSQKNDLKSQVQSQIDSLNTLKTKIAGDTDIATLRTDVQSIVKSYRIYALFIPKAYIIVHADRLLNIADEMNQISTKLQSRIDSAKSAGNDTSAAQTLMTDRAAKIADAITQAQNAIKAVMPLTPDGFPGNKTTLQSARTMLQTARADLRAAHKDGMQILQILRGFKKTTTTPKPTPTP